MRRALFYPCALEYLIIASVDDSQDILPNIYKSEVRIGVKEKFQLQPKEDKIMT